MLKNLAVISLLRHWIHLFLLQLQLLLLLLPPG
jgi:hypothetical protein